MKLHNFGPHAATILELLTAEAAKRERDPTRRLGLNQLHEALRGFNRQEFGEVPYADRAAAAIAALFAQTPRSILTLDAIVTANESRKTR